MLEFILSYYFLILWGLSLSVLILLTFAIIYKKELSDKIKAIYEKIVKDDNNPYKKEFDEIHEHIDNNNVCVIKILTTIQEEQIKINSKIDNNLEKSSAPMIFDVDELSQDIAETLTAKLQAKKVDKLSKGAK